MTVRCADRIETFSIERWTGQEEMEEEEEKDISACKALTRHKTDTLSSFRVFLGGWHCPYTFSICFLQRVSDKRSQVNVFQMLPVLLSNVNSITFRLSRCSAVVCFVATRLFGFVEKSKTDHVAQRISSFLFNIEMQLPGSQSSRKAMKMIFAYELIDWSSLIKKFWMEIEIQ